MGCVTIEQLARIYPSAAGEVLDAVLSAIDAAGLTCDVRTAAYFLAQIGHESAGLRHTREIGGEKARYAPWYGRGYIQITWWANYEACAAATGLDCVHHPEVLESVDGAIASAIWFYMSHGLHRLAHFDTISTRINGAGITPASLASRRTWLARVQQVLGG